jgi:ribosomal protein S13
MKHHYILEDRLRYNIKNRFLIFKEAGLIKSKRIESGLPIHGQRTHSNAKSPKRRKIYY